jgi:2-polyprenyl-3-methyl-5-hydroxy-6-metoxy-1,4-benzoquinol methylase
MGEVAKMSTQITYGNYHEAALEYEAFLKKIIHEHGFKNLCDVGGGANPLLSPEFVLEHSLEYTLLDISQAELDKAAPQYQKVKADICAPNYTGQKYDFVFSKMLAEHVVQGQQFHQNIYAMLAPGGIALHFFPTLYALPFLINRSIPEKLANFLLSLFVGRDHYQHSKFPAYYSWCRGPSHRQIQNFEKLGY